MVQVGPHKRYNAHGDSLLSVVKPKGGSHGRYKAHRGGFIYGMTPMVIVFIRHTRPMDMTSYLHSKFLVSKYMSYAFLCFRLWGVLSAFQWKKIHISLLRFGSQKIMFFLCQISREISNSQLTTNIPYPMSTNKWKNENFYPMGPNLGFMTSSYYP